jgi:hypothetical protein
MGPVFLLGKKDEAAKKTSSTVATPQSANGSRADNVETPKSLKDAAVT